MKLSRTIPMANITIREPRWKNRTVGIATFRVQTHNKIVITKTNKDGDRYFPNAMYMSGELIKKYPTQNLSNGVVLYLVPIADLEVIEE